MKLSTQITSNIFSSLSRSNLHMRYVWNQHIWSKYDLTLYLKCMSWYLTKVRNQLCSKGVVVHHTCTNADIINRCSCSPSRPHTHGGKKNTNQNTIWSSQTAWGEITNWLFFLIMRFLIVIFSCDTAVFIYRRLYNSW